MELVNINDGKISNKEIITGNLNGCISIIIRIKDNNKYFGILTHFFSTKYSNHFSKIYNLLNRSGLSQNYQVTDIAIFYPTEEKETIDIRIQELTKLIQPNRTIRKIKYRILPGPNFDRQILKNIEKLKIATLKFNPENGKFQYIPIIKNQTMTYLILLLES